MDWIKNVILGFISGFCEPLPLSAEAHRGMLYHIMGLEPQGAIFHLFCRIAVLVVLLWAGKLELHRLHRTSRLLRAPSRRRTGRPELNSAGTLRMLPMAAVPAVAGQILAPRLAFMARRMWMPVVPLLLCGLILWLPSHFRTANKDGRHLSTADGLLMGLGFLLGAVPGLSGVALAISFGTLRGCSRSYALRFTWLLTVISLLAGSAMDALTLVLGGFTLDAGQLLRAGLGGVSAALGAYLAIHLARSRIRPTASGLGEFCYYNWGQALLLAALFLLV